VQNVVTYDAVIDVSNPQVKLRPGMTANVKIMIDRVSSVLKLPNSALRFKPDLTETDLAAAYLRAGEGEFYQNSRTVSRGAGSNANQGAGPSTGVRPTAFSADGSRPSQRSGANPGNTAGFSPRGRRTSVWILGKDQLFKPVVVRLGLTDGVSTQIVEGHLEEGDKLVIGQDVETKPASAGVRLPGFGNMTGSGRR
jgi:HlyD family secretion protein